jgi:hypothetical protein
MKFAPLMLAALAMPAFADDNLSWNHPTTRTDSSALPLSEIAATVIRYRTSTTGTDFVTLEVPAPANTTVVARDPLLAGTRCYSAATRDTDGLMGDFSLDVCKTIVKAKPRRPQNLVVQ